MDNIQSVSVVSPIVPSIGDALSKLVGARREFIKSIKSGDTSLKAYAAWMCSTFNVCDETGKVIKPWYALAGKAKAGVNAEFKAFAEDLQAAGYAEGVEYTYWGRVKDESGRPKKSGKVGGESTDPMEKTRAEIGTIINRINNSRDDKTESSERMIEIYEIMCEAYATLGGVVSDLKTEAVA
jgi:hypothetical protein